MSFDSHMAEKKFDLNALPPGVRYLIALVLVAVVGGAGWYVGRDRPTPYWIEHYLIPGLGWLGLLLIVLAVADWIRRRR
jgi:hypothetical protein